jgi:uncharacterized integral membrane protein (TIGR00697 family)
MKYFHLVLTVFIASLMIANTISIKVVDLVYFSLPAGIIIYPLVSVAGDVLTEVYGYEYARRAIWCGFIALILMNISFFLATSLPPSPFWKYETAYDQILSSVPRITFASLCAYPVGEFVNSYILAKLKVFQKGKGLKKRFVLSTLGGQATDSAIFISIAFLGVLPMKSLLLMMIVSCTAKVCWEVSFLYFSSKISVYLKSVENIDVYDTDTNFNPIKY